MLTSSCIDKNKKEKKTTHLHRMEVHIRYKVGAREVQLRNVGLIELDRGLTELHANDEHRKIIAALFKMDPDASTVDDWLNNLVNPQDGTQMLELTEGVTCKTSFLNKFYRSKTLAGNVLCLLKAHIEHKQVQEKEAENAQLRNFALPPSSSGGAATAVTVDVSNEEVKQWLRKWEAKNRS